jgi:hypothetical protein
MLTVTSVVLLDHARRHVLRVALYACIALGVSFGMALFVAADKWFAVTKRPTAVRRLYVSFAIGVVLVSGVLPLVAGHSPR